MTGEAFSLGPSRAAGAGGFAGERQIACDPLGERSTDHAVAVNALLFARDPDPFAVMHLQVRKERWIFLAAGMAVVRRVLQRGLEGGWDIVRAKRQLLRARNDYQKALRRLEIAEQRYIEMMEA